MSIRSFRDQKTEALYRGGRVKEFSGFTRTAERKLQSLDSAESLTDLRAIPGNRLEKLQGGRQGQYSIRINAQWRVCFEWKEDGAHNVEIVDYH